MTKYPTLESITNKNQDRIDLNKTAIKATNFIDNLETPAFFGIYGCWGSGKTTLMHFIQNEITEKHQETHATLWFDAWKYEMHSSSAMIFALFKLIISKYEDNSDRLKKLITNALPTLLELGIDTLGSKSGIQNSSESIGSRIAKLFKSGLTKKYEAYQSEIDSIEKFKLSFEKEIDMLLKRVKKDKLIIFIDDMDRCATENVLRFLEILKHFVSVKKCIFVIGIDNRVVVSHINNFFPEAAFGEEYLQKIIPYGLYVPARRLTPLALDILTQSDRFTSSELKSISEIISNHCSSNIRLAQITLNKLVFYCEYIDLASLTTQLLDKSNNPTNRQLTINMLAKWLLIKEIMPAFTEGYRWDLEFAKIIENDVGTGLTPRQMEVRTIAMGGSDTYDQAISTSQALLLETTIRESLY
jgi:hypothetical protein